MATDTRSAVEKERERVAARLVVAREFAPEIRAMRASDAKANAEIQHAIAVDDHKSGKGEDRAFYKALDRAKGARRARVILAETGIGLDGAPLDKGPDAPSVPPSDVGTDAHAE